MEAETETETISFKEFMRLDLRVAKILKAEKVPGADKLLKLAVKIGGEERTIAAGIAEHYSPAELEGRKIVVVANLESKRVRGVESRGMLLAACTDDESKIVFVTPEKEIEDGARVR